MNSHPSRLMLRTWIICALAFIVLPFQLVDRDVTVYGFAILALFILVFCSASYLGGRPAQQQPFSDPSVIDWKRADYLLRLAATIALVALLFDASRRNVFDLAATYSDRSDRAQDILVGDASGSGLA